MEKMENELQRFERLCKQVGIPVTTVNFYVTQQQVYKLFQAIVKDCEGITIENDLEANVEKEAVIKKLRRYTYGLTIKELGNLLACSEEKIKTLILELKKENLLKEDGERWKLKIIS